MNSRILISIVLTCGLFSGCTTYKTNTDIKFESTRLGGIKPEIYVGDIEETPDKLEYLGWVEAVVTSPSVFERAPTKEQANIVLGALGAAKGADAVTYVSYDTTSANLNKQLKARGQAVIIKDPILKERIFTIQEKEKLQQSNIYKDPEITDIVITIDDVDLDELDKQELANTTDSTNNMLNESDEEIFTSQMEEQFDTDSNTIVMPFNLTPTTTEVSRRAYPELYEQSTQRSSEDTSNCQPEVVKDESPELFFDAQTQIDNIKLMISNAEYIQKNAKEKQQKAQANAANRLIQLLTNQLHEFERIAAENIENEEE